jgi:hypothetical protein
MSAGKYEFLFVYVFICLITFTSSELAGQDIKDKDIIVKIGDNFVYTFDDLRNYASDWNYIKRNKDRSEAYGLALEAMVTNQLKRIDFFNKGLDKDENVMQDIRRIIQEEIVIEYFNRQYLSKYTNDDFVKKIYAIADKKVSYQRILLSYLQSPSDKQKELLKNKAMDIKKEVDKGTDFGRLVKKYSQDSISLSTNGIVPAVEWEQSLKDPLGAAIFNLKSGDVRVLDTQEGLYIIKVVKIDIIKLEPFEKIKDELRTKIKDIYFDTCEKEFQEDKEKLVNADSILWNKESLAKITTWSNIPRFYVNSYEDTLKNAISENNFTILTYPNGQVDLKKFLFLLKNVLIPKFAGNASEENIKLYLIEALISDKVSELARKIDIDDKILNINTDNPLLKNQIAILYNKELVDKRIPEPTIDNLKKFYNSEKDSLYYQLHKVYTYVMLFPDKDKAEETIKVIKDGTAFEKITGRWLVKTFIRDRNGEIKSFASQEAPFLGKDAFKLSLNETAGPIEYVDPEKGTQFAVIKCVNILPEKQLTYDEVKKNIGEDFRNVQREKIMQEVRDYLWAKYTPQVFTNILNEKISSK